MFLSRFGVEHTVISEDYEVELEQERADMAENRKSGQKGYAQGHADFARYWTNAEMEAYMLDMAARHPQHVSVENMAFSPEGRRILVVKISSGTFGQRPIIAMETGMHAR